MSSVSPFHEGEQRVQERLGVRDGIEAFARKVVRSYLPEEHRAFYAQLPFLPLAARDQAGRPWATLLVGEPGFLDSPDPQSLEIAALPAPGDALADALIPGADVGLLGIELHTRRRNRVNGQVDAASVDGFRFRVGQSFGNCPQYITDRNWRRVAPSAPAPRASRSAELSARQRRAIAAADTFFIATGYRREGSESAAYGMDVSHRGGAPGFVRADARGLVFPDYAGNNHFNTIGNLLLDARVGLAFVDFESGDLLQITGRAEIDWDSPEVADFPGARRLVRIQVDEVVELRAALPLRFERATDLHAFEVVGKRRESEDVVSFTLRSRDGAAAPAFEPGQYLPIELTLPGQPAPLERTYSLSGSPADRTSLRVTVKRHDRGLGSRHLHDAVSVGSIVNARPPRGEFVLDAKAPRPIVLLSAGVGVTPLVSMLHAASSRSGGRPRPLWFVHGARDGAHHPLRGEIEQLVAADPDTHLHVAYSRPLPEDRIGRDYQSQGRIDAQLVEKLVPGLDADYYVCGPTGFMAAIHEELVARGVAEERIHAESFGAGA